MAKVTSSNGFPLGSMLIPISGVGLHPVRGFTDPPQQVALLKQVLNKCRGP